MGKKEDSQVAARPRPDRVGTYRANHAPKNTRPDSHDSPQETPFGALLDGSGIQADWQERRLGYGAGETLRRPNWDAGYAGGEPFYLYANNMA
jgi:hypothetical protein